MTVRGFKDKIAEAVFNGQRPKSFPADVTKVTRRKLEYLDAAISLDDLRVPTANWLEALKGDRKGQYSIRINDQYRLCFVWTDAGPEDVEFTDYH
jgi:proteic killer suppression protein